MSETSWRNLFARIAGFHITKRRYETLEKSIAVWVALLAIFAAAAKFYDRNTGALYISLAGAFALLIGLNFFIRHRTNTWCYN